MPNHEAAEADKAALVAEALRHFKASGAAKDRTQWFFEVLVEAAGVETVRVALRVFDPDFVTSAKEANGKPGPRFKSHGIARALARRFDRFQKENRRMAANLLWKHFVETLPDEQRRHSLKRLQNLISLGRKLNRQRPQHVRLAWALKHGGLLYAFKSKRDIARELRKTAERISDEELRDKLAEAEYLKWAASAALIDGNSGPLRLIRK
jgi:hypothetical protein